MKSFFEKPNRSFRGPGRKMLRTVLSCLLTLAVLAGASYGWYVRNIELQSTTGKVMTASGAGAYATSYSVFLYNTDFSYVDRHDYYGNMTDEEIASLAAIQLHGYDTYFTDRNDKNPAIICIPVFGTDLFAGRFTVNIQCTGKLWNATYPNKLDEYLSNVVSFRCAWLNIIPPGAPNETYENNYDLFSNVHNTLTRTEEPFEYKTFVNRGETWTKGEFDGEFNDAAPYTISFEVTRPDNFSGDLAYVYIEIDYDQNLVIRYRTDWENSDTSIFNGSQSWNCAGDLSSIYFSH